MLHDVYVHDDVDAHYDITGFADVFVLEAICHS